VFPVLSFSEILPVESPPQNFSAVSWEIQAVPLTWLMHENTKVSGYVIYRSDSKGSAFKEIAKVPSRYITSYLDGKEAALATFKQLTKLLQPLLSDNKNYYYKIATIVEENSIGEFSEIIKATTAPKPSPPLNFRAFGGGAGIVSLNWLPPKDKTVTGYRIYRKSSEDKKLLSIKGISGRLILSYVDEGDITEGDMKKPLENSHEYFYAISSLNQAKAESYITKIISAITKNAPPPVEGISASKGKARSIEIAWHPSPIVDLKHYAILKKRIDSLESQKEIRVPADTTTYFDENLPDGVRYHYQVKAVDIDGLEGTPSLEASGTTKSIPSTPKNIDVEVFMDEDKLTIKWDKNPEPDIVKYEIYKISGFIGVMKKLGITKEPSFVDRNVKKGARVSYEIVAVDEDNLKSKRSDTTTVLIPKQ
jgi:fibronectin type 3 domain-containing protein